jgi:hypothetical protein
VNDKTVERIECAIAKHWPDVDRVCAAANCAPHQVHAVMERLDAIHTGKRHEHDCAKHGPGAVACYDEHNCWCGPCQESAKARARQQRLNAAKPLHLRGHAEYERLRKTGIPTASMPAWVIQGERLYHSLRKREPAA